MPCLSFFDQTLFYNQNIYEIKEKNLTSQKEALKKIEEWDYNNLTENQKIPIGIFYKIQKPTYEERMK